MEEPLHKAAVYYKEKILPNVYIITLYDKRKIIIYPEEYHFKHLTGIQHLNTSKYDLDIKFKNPKRFFRECLKKQFNKDQFLTSEFLTASSDQKNEGKFDTER